MSDQLADCIGCAPNTPGRKDKPHTFLLHEKSPCGACGTVGQRPVSTRDRGATLFRP